MATQPRGGLGAQRPTNGLQTSSPVTDDSGMGRVGTRACDADDGFSLLELLIVIVVIGILAGIVVFGVGAFRSDSAAAADQANLKQLNVASSAYRATAAAGEGLDDLASDTARMQALFDRGLLTDDASGSRVVTPQVEGAVFAWDPVTQSWMLSLGAPDLYDFAAAGTPLSGFRTFGTWTKSGTSGFTSSYGQLFAPNARSEYTVSYTAALTPYSAYGGNALLLTSALAADNRDTGYAIQFDRGISATGSIVIRSREPNAASPSQIKESLLPGFTFNNGNTKGAIPDKGTPDGKAWWAASHVVSARVSSVDATTRKVEYSIDGKVLFDNFTFTASADPSAGFVGLRAWGDTSTFGRLSVG